MTVLHKILLESILLYQTAFQLVNTCSTNEVEYMLCMTDIQFVILSFCKNANWIIVTEYKEYKLQIESDKTTSIYNVSTRVLSKK